MSSESSPDHVNGLSPDAPRERVCAPVLDELPGPIDRAAETRCSGSDVGTELAGVSAVARVSGGVSGLAVAAALAEARVEAGRGIVAAGSASVAIPTPQNTHRLTPG
jgi:hypothetical protein